MVVMPSSRWTRRFQAHCPRSWASRFDRGSSIRNALGARTIARPIATRWRCPPDRSAASPEVLAEIERRGDASHERAGPHPWAPGRQVGGNAMFSKIDMCGYSA